MKERIVVTKKEDIDFIETYQNVDYTKEQVPETWTELLELCAKYEELDTVNFIIIKGVWFDKDGEVSIGEETIAENRTPEQMWQIIKSLIGEE